MTTVNCPKCKGICHEIDSDETEWECEDCGYQFQATIKEEDADD